MPTLLDFALRTLVVVAAVIVLWVFFSLWHRFLERNRGAPAMELLRTFVDPERPINLVLKNGQRYERVRLCGRLDGKDGKQVPPGLDGMLVFEGPDEGTIYLKASAIRLIEVPPSETPTGSTSAP